MFDGRGPGAVTDRAEGDRLNPHVARGEQGREDSADVHALVIRPREPVLPRERLGCQTVLDEDLSHDNDAARRNLSPGTNQRCGCVLGFEQGLTCLER